MAGWSDSFAAVAVDEYVAVYCGGAAVGADDVGGGEGCREEAGLVEAWGRRGLLGLGAFAELAL